MICYDIELSCSKVKGPYMTMGKMLNNNQQFNDKLSLMFNHTCSRHFLLCFFFSFSMEVPDPPPFFPEPRMILNEYQHY